MVAVLSGLALLAAGCSSSGLKAGDAATFAEGFGGEISVDGEQWESRADGDAVPDGAQVRATDGEARLVLRDGTARLAPGAAATVTTNALQLERGELLLDSDGGLEVRLGDTAVVAGGTVRVSSGLAASVGVYAGTATVRRPAQEREVASLRQMDLAAFRLAPVGVPLRYSPEHPWDQELLAEAIAFDGEVARLARGMEIEFGTRPQPAGFYREFAAPRVVPVLSAAAPVSRGRTFGPPADVLLTMFVAQTATQGRLIDSIRQVAQLRGAGARWGLIAVEFDVASDALVAAVDGVDSERLALAERTPSSAAGNPAVVAAAPTRSGAGRETAQATSSTTGATGSTTGGSPTGGTSGSSGGDASSGSGGGGGGDGDDGDDGGDDPPDDEPPPPEKVVSDVVKTVKEKLPDDPTLPKTGLPAPPPLP